MLTIEFFGIAPLFYIPIKLEKQRKANLLPAITIILTKCVSHVGRIFVEFVYSIPLCVQFLSNVHKKDTMVFMSNLVEKILVHMTIVSHLHKSWSRIQQTFLIV